MGLNQIWVRSTQFRVGSGLAILTSAYVFSPLPILPISVFVYGFPLLVSIVKFRRIAVGFAPQMQATPKWRKICFSTQTSLSRAGTNCSRTNRLESSNKSPITEFFLLLQKYLQLSARPKPGWSQYLQQVKCTTASIFSSYSHQRASHAPSAQGEI